MKTKLPGGVLCDQHEGQRGDQTKDQKGHPHEAGDVAMTAGDDVELLSVRLGHENPLYWYLDTEGVQLQTCQARATSSDHRMRLFGTSLYSVFRCTGNRAG